MIEEAHINTEYTSEELRTVWQSTAESFGEQTIGFLLKLETGVLPDFLDSPRWGSVLMLEMLSQQVPRDRPSEVQTSYKVHCLTQRGPKTSTLAEAIRIQAGGEVPQVTGNDHVLQKIMPLAFAALAAEHIPGLVHDRFSLSAAFQDPSVMVPLCQAFMADKSLKKLFPESPHPIGLSNYSDIIAIHQWSLGGGGTTWLIIMLGNMIEQTLATMRLERTLKEESLAPYLARSLDALRKAANGEEIEVSVIAGLKGAAPERDLRTNRAGILPAAGLALEVMPNDTPPHSVAYVKAKTRLLSILRNEPADDNQLHAELMKHRPELQRVFQQVRRDFDLVRFWIVVWAHENDLTAIKPTLTGWWVMNPVFKTTPAFDGETSQQPQDMHGGGPTRQLLNGSDLSGIEELAGRFNEVPQTLSLGVTRIVRAVVERDDPMDSFVDAVIAWENLVGAATETTFRVCAALATLLEPKDAERRTEMLSSLKKAYNKRSRLVHGGDEPKHEELGQLRDSAIDVAIRAMQAVLEDDRLAVLKSSSDRSDAILVGDWRPRNGY